MASNVRASETGYERGTACGEGPAEAEGLVSETEPAAAVMGQRPVAAVTEAAAAAWMGPSLPFFYHSIQCDGSYASSSCSGGGSRPKDCR